MPVGANDVPMAFSFGQNYPNPFRGMTAFRFDVPEPSRVGIRVYDVRGREVASVLEAQMEPGRHSTPWLGHDARGEGLPAGVYFAQFTAHGLQSGRSLVSRKTIVLIR